MLSLYQSVQQNFDLVDGSVRVSCANLVTHFTVTGTGKFCSVPVAIINKRSMHKGEPKWQALGGGANVTRKGVQILRKRFEATDFEIDEKSGLADARFVVPGNLLHDVAYWLISQGNILVEAEPSREFQKETGVSDVDMEEIWFQEIGVAIQPPSEVGADTSDRSVGKPPSRRIFRCFEAVLSIEACISCLGGGGIRFMNSEELSLTEGGRCGAKLKDGSIIANNLGVEICSV